MFLGFVVLGQTFSGFLQTRDSSRIPKDADALPNRMVYAMDGTKITAVNGAAALAHTGAITGATNANPIVITSTAHGLQTGARVTISGVGGNTNANTTVSITRVSADTFSLDAIAGNSGYTSGGTFHVSGLYTHSFTASNGNGFAAGNTYYVLSTYAMSSSSQADLDSFTVT